MKRILCFLFLLTATTAVFAQEGEKEEIQTLFGKRGDRSNGAYGGVTVNYSQIDDRDAILIGGRGAWLINHRVGIGIAGSGFLTDYRFDEQLNADYQLVGGYGGLFLEFIVNPTSPVHVSFPMTIGAGGATYVERNRFFDRVGPNGRDSYAFFVIEPGVEVELNLVKFMRIAFGASYRYTSDLDLTYLNSNNNIVGDDALKGFSGGITLKFGKF